MKIPSRKLAALTGVLCMLWFALLLSGCGPDPDTPMRKRSVTIEQTPLRFEVTRVGVFADDLAYDGRRGIYVIHDQETGTTYLGISGIGISELGQHSTGKTMLPDER